MVILYKNLCKNIILKGHIFVSLQVILQLEALFFCNIVILGGDILNISKTVFPKVIFDQRLKNQLGEVLFWEFYIRSRYIINHSI